MRKLMMLMAMFSLSATLVTGCGRVTPETAAMLERPSNESIQELPQKISSGPEITEEQDELSRKKDNGKHDDKGLKDKKEKKDKYHRGSC